MAIKLPDGRIMRTLPEQVDKNMQDIASINNEVNVIKESITTAYKIQGSATVADLNANTKDAAMNGYVYNMTDAGSLINSDESTTSVQIGDNVVLVWNDGNYFWDRLSGVVDTSNLVTLDSDQEITGTKTFSSYLKIGTNAFINGNYGNFYIGFGTNNTKIAITTSNFTAELNLIPWSNNAFDLGSAGSKWKDIYLGGAVISNDFKNSNGTSMISFPHDGAVYVKKSLYSNGLLPYGAANNIGTSSSKWIDLYLSGNISDGTNSVAVAEIIKKRLTVSYNVSAAASSGISLINLTLSAADLAKLDSTKPLIVANNSTSAAVISAVYLPALNLFTVLAYQTQGNTSLAFDIYQ